jgi:hypothetical protein
MTLRQFYLPDSGGRRSGIERRKFSYSVHIPERRCGQDRRSDIDRRSGKDRRSTLTLGMHKEIVSQELNKAMLT